MGSLKTAFYLGVCLSAWIITTADGVSLPKAENVLWVSLDFKTILTWTTTSSNDTYTVLYSWDDSNWEESPDCIRVSESECDLTNCLDPLNRLYSADIKTEAATMDYDDYQDESPHTYSPHINPYEESKISAVKFSVEVVEESNVTVMISDPVTSIHKQGRQLTIRDILKDDLKYKISYYKSGSTRKRDIISDSSIAKVSGLDPGVRYCFMVAAFIPSRPKTFQHGAWSILQCTPEQEMNLGALVGGLLILLIVLIIIVTVTILCCKCCRQRNKTLQTSQSSTVV
ncbi:tissue factor-like isoform X2 [Scomber scombrus]|uniref:tissue factor-like isoform X2 n=1 Tax=Scomber scombrus TaxID=13677 RepID=UPI002DDC2C96|nr:tissue factor-like isoform X2 [Scomber scombrus]